MIAGPWGHDRAWESEVVRRIREGGPAPCALSPYDATPSMYWENSGLYGGGWQHAEELSKNAIRNNSVFLNDEAIAQRKVFREGVRAAQAEAKARAEKAEADRRANRAAQDEARRAWEQQRIEYERRAREQRELWEADDHAQQVKRIMASKWVCVACSAPSSLAVEDNGYRLACSACGKTAFGSHESLWRIVSR